jgi:hypothetical protein
VAGQQLLKAPRGRLAGRTQRLQQLRVLQDTNKAWRENTPPVKLLQQGEMAGRMAGRKQPYASAPAVCIQQARTWQRKKANSM